MNDAPAFKPVDLDKSAIARILIGVMLAIFLAALDQTIVATALPTIGGELNDLEHLPWIVTAYLLSGTAATPLYGKFADIYGRRASLLVGIIVFIVGSAACALAPTMLFLIVARFVQGLGGGGLIALGQTITADIIPPRERMKYQAYFAGVFVTASVVGPVVGGFVAEKLHWSLIFWINLPLGALALALTYNQLRRLPRVERPHRVDVIGALLMIFATTALLLALSWGGSTYPWGSVQVIGLLIASAVAWVLFAVRLLTAVEPFIPLVVMANPVVGAATISNFFVVGSMIALSIYLPVYFEAVVGLTAGQSGLALLALTAGAVVGAIIAGRIMAWTPHYKRGPTIGLAMAVVATAILAFSSSSLTMWQFEALLAATGLGLGTIFPVSTVAVQNAVEPHQLGTTTAAFNFFRSLGSAVLVAAFGAIFLSGLGFGGGEIGSIAALVAEAARKGISIAPVFDLIFAASSVALALGLVFFLFMEERPLRGRG